MSGERMRMLREYLAKRHAVASDAVARGFSTADRTAELEAVIAYTLKLEEHCDHCGARGCSGVCEDDS